MTRYLLGAVVNAWRHLRKIGTGGWERGRLRSIEAMSAPLHSEPVAEKDQELVDAIHAIVVETRTDERPIVAPVRRRRVDKPPTRQQLARMRARVAAERQAPLDAFAADPLAAPIPTEHVVAEPVLFTDQAVQWFTRPALVAPPEPAPLPALDFTGEYRSDMFVRGAR